jgi:hypothetical protein
MSHPSAAIARHPWPARLRRKQASAYLRERHGITLSAATLAKLAVVGGGPAFRKDGPFPLYEVDILDAFATARLGPLRTSTGDGRRPDR